MRTKSLCRFIFEYLVNSIGKNSRTNSLTLRTAFVKPRESIFTGETHETERFRPPELSEKWRCISRTGRRSGASRKGRGHAGRKIRSARERLAQLWRALAI
jgi:hypothetical protein